MKAITNNTRRLFERVQRLQARYWALNGDLEAAIGRDIDTERDLDELRIEDLLVDAAKCPQCGKPHEKSDIDGGRCLGCGTMLCESEDGEPDDDTPITDAEFIQAKYGVDSQMAEAMARATATGGSK